MNFSEIANVSVIIPCYCCTGTVERALRSVVQQSMPPVEIILVDDASNDDGATLSCLKQLIHQFEGGGISIRLMSLAENGGPSVARNAAWDVATAECVAFLDADDAWHPKKLEIQYRWMKMHPEVVLSGHFCNQMDTSMSPLDSVPQCSARPCELRSMLFKNPLSTRTVMTRRDLPLRFAADKRYAEDFLLWLQIAASGVQIYVLDVVLAYSFKPAYGESGLSGDLWRMERGELDNFCRLYKAGSIAGSMYVAASVFSLLKYVRRMIIGAYKRIYSSKWG